MEIYLIKWACLNIYYNIYFYYYRILNKVFKRSLLKGNKMGWLFGKKKIVPKVPFPEGKPFNEKELQFSKKEAPERVIEPGHVQAAAGLDKPIIPPEEPLPEDQEQEEHEEAPVPQPFTNPVQQPFAEQKAEPLYIKMDVYQKILEELNEIKGNLSGLKEIGKKLEDSEYNEENNFLKLKKITKVMHDRLLQADKIIFKGD